MLIEIEERLALHATLFIQAYKYSIAVFCVIKRIRIRSKYVTHNIYESRRSADMQI